MTLKSVLRLGHMCKIMYGLTLLSVVIYTILQLSLSTSDDSHKPRTTTRGRSLLEAIKSHISQAEIRRLHRLTGLFNESPYNNKRKSSLFLTGQKFSRTLELMQSKSKINSSWHGGQRYCENNLEIINADIVYMRNVILDTKQKFSKPKGGESIINVLHQKESDENVEIKNGFFKLLCSNLPSSQSIQFSRLFHQWFSVIQPIQNKTLLILTNTTEDFVIMRRRGDYANLYWTLIELYDTYISVKLLGKYPELTTVVLVDAHPMGKLDSMWNMLFKKVIRIGNIEGEMYVKELAWALNGVSSPVSQSCRSLPFIQSFKRAFYTSVGFNSERPLNLCSTYDGKTSKVAENTTITLILRRNYVAHPRNPSGKIMRKIVNEKELIEYLGKRFFDYSFKAVQLDTLSLEDQIRLITQTSILIGVHGAGMAYNLLLQPGATVIELFPSVYKRAPNHHFEQFAEWGGVRYLSWYAPHSDRDLEWIKIPLDVTEKLINNALNTQCP